MNSLELIQAFQLALKAVQMYTDTHPKTQDALKSIQAALEGALEKKPSIHLAASNGKLFLDAQVLDGQNLHVKSLLERLTERRISGFIIQHGATFEELLAVLKLLSLKPQRLVELGGAAKVLSEQRLAHISLSQTKYKEVHGDGNEDPTIPSLGLDLGGLTSLSPSASVSAEASLKDMVSAWQKSFQNLVGQPKPEIALGNDDDSPYEITAILTPANLSQFAAPQVGSSSAGPVSGAGPVLDQRHFEAMKQALQALQTDSLFAIFAGIGSLPQGANDIAKALHDLAPQLISNAVVARMKAGSPWEPIQEQLFEMLKNSPAQQAVLHSLDTNFSNHGLDSGLLNGLFRQMAFQSLSLQDKLKRVMDGEGLWEINDVQRMELFKALLEAKEVEALNQMLDRVLKQLQVDNPQKRRQAALLLPKLDKIVNEEGAPKETRSIFRQALVSHFVWEPLPDILIETQKTLEQMLEREVRQGELENVQGLMQEVENLSSFLGDLSPFRAKALEDIRNVLLRADLIELALEQMYDRQVEEDHPTTISGSYFTFLGQEAVRVLMQALEDEPDAKRRKRLLELIRSLGSTALPAVREGLQSDTWYLVRNALNLLSDIGEAQHAAFAEPFLTHGDVRVQRTAVRALWRLGNMQAAAPLARRLPLADPETQLEIVFGLAQIRASSAVPALLEQLQRPGCSLRVRIKIADCLGVIREASATPVLLGLLRRQGRFFSSAVEPSEMRMAAARALLAIDSDEAKAGLAQILETEPNNADREQLRQMLGRL